MSADTRIPPELARFLRRESYSLLIKGETGTGKTGLALSILRLLESRNFLYLSTRLSLDTLFQRYRWLREYFDLPLRQNKSGPQPRFPSMFVDARLEEPTQLFEKITNELMDAAAPLIVIDTWNSIGDFMDKEALLSNARVLQTWRERGRAKMIMIGENPSDISFDSLVEGIVVLKKSYSEGRLVRQIIQAKLGGEAIGRPIYFFTTKDEVFRSFEPFPRSDLMVEGSYAPPRQAARITRSSLISSGYEELDEAIEGGFPLGSVVNIELGENLSERIAILFLARILSAIRASGGTVMLYPFGDLEAESVTSLLRAIMLTKDTERSRGHLDVSGTSEDGTPPKQKRKSIEKVVIRAGNGPEKKPIVNVIEPGMLEYSLKPEGGRRLALLTALLRSSVDLTVLITKESDRRVVRGMSGLVERRVKIIDRNGVLFVLPEVPWSGAFVMSMEKHPHLRIDLAPIV